MNLDCKFRFRDADLNKKLIDLLQDRRISYLVNKEGLIHYSNSDVDVVENVLINSLRSSLFPSWQVLSCPEDWVSRYENYMQKHGIHYRVEITDGEVNFLIPGSHNPLRWNYL